MTGKGSRKCRRNKSGAKFCDAMLNRFSLGQRRGLNSVTSLNLMLGATRLIGVRYCMTGKPKDRGTMLNFCPWCGENIQWWPTAAAQHEAEGEGHD